MALGKDGRVLLCLPPRGFSVSLQHFSLKENVVVTGVVGPFYSLSESGRRGLVAAVARLYSL